MSFGNFLVTAMLYLSLMFIFLSLFVYVMSLRYRSQQNQMLYYPEMPPESRESCEDPVSLGIPNAERIVVVTADKVRLRGFMLWPQGSRMSSANGDGGAGSKPPSTSSQSGASPGPVAVPVGCTGTAAEVVSSAECAATGDLPAPANCGGGGSSAVRAATASPSTTTTTTFSSSALPTFVLLYFHGNAGNVGHRLSLAQAFVANLKCAVMMVDYRGFGRSDDAEPIQEGLELDAQACFDFLWHDHRVPRDRIVVMGTSLGGAVAIHLAANEKYARRIQAVIVENTFTSVGDMASALGRPILNRLVSPCPGFAMGVFEYYVKPLALHLRWRSIRRVRKVVAPMLFLSGVQDELVPPEQMRVLYKESTKCLRDGNNGELTVPLRRFQEFDDGMHNNLPLMPGYMGVIQKFMIDVNSGNATGVV